MLLLLALFSAMAVLLGSGCGGDDSATTSAAGGDTTSAAKAGGTAEDGKAPEKKESAAGSDQGAAAENKKSAAEDGGSAGDGGAASGSQGSASSGGAPDAGGGESAGSTGGSAEAGSSLTKAEFVKQGNAACDQIQKRMGKEFEARTKELTDKGISPSKEQAKKMIAGVAIPAAKKQISVLRALPAPSGDEKKVALIIARQEESLKKVEEEPLFRASGAPYEKLNKPASDYGLTKCAE